MRSGAERIIVPLDVPTAEEAIELVNRLRDHVGMFKIGFELLYHEGIEVVGKITGLGMRVFLDTKLLDIPNTVAGAARGITRLGVAMFNVHTTGGYDMMKAAVGAAHDEAQLKNIERPLVLGVTILTSIDQDCMNDELRVPGAVKEQVVHLAQLAEQAGLDGIIASPQEIEGLRERISERMLIVTPGIRPTWAAALDQKRIMTPGEAMLRGASYIVIGRPITRPPSEIGSPEDAAMKIADEIASASSRKEGT
jgi:orotidine-5'-phosphate decarboxylase